MNLELLIVCLIIEHSRRLFKEPDVIPAADVDLKWEKPDEEGLINFLCVEKGFQEERIRNGAKKLLKGRQGSTQGRLDSFFKVQFELRKIFQSVRQCNAKSQNL